MVYSSSRRQDDSLASQPWKNDVQMSNLGVGDRRLVLVQIVGCLLGPETDALVRVCLFQGGESFHEEIVMTLVDEVELHAGSVDTSDGSPESLSNSRASGLEWSCDHNEGWGKGAGIGSGMEPHDLYQTRLVNIRILEYGHNQAKLRK